MPAVALVLNIDDKVELVVTIVAPGDSETLLGIEVGFDPNRGSCGVEVGNFGGSVFLLSEGLLVTIDLIIVEESLILSESLLFSTELGVKPISGLLDN